MTQCSEGCSRLMCDIGTVEIGLHCASFYALAGEETGPFSVASGLRMLFALLNHDNMNRRDNYLRRYYAFCMQYLNGTGTR